MPWQQCEIEIVRELRVAITSMELRKTNQQLSLALSATKIGFWDWDVQKNRIVWSREHEELFGLARELLPELIKVLQLAFTQKI